MNDTLRLKLMPVRFEDLQAAYAGYVQTGVPLVGTDGKTLRPLVIYDDIGIYYLIPKLAVWLGLSLERSIELFFLLIISLSLVIGLAGCMMTFKTWAARLSAIVGLSGLALLCLKAGDVYMISPAVAIALVPWILFAAERTNLGVGIFIGAFVSGVVLAVAHYSRSHSGTAVILFGLVMLLWYAKVAWRQKGLLIACVVAGSIIALTMFGSAVNKRDAYLRTKLAGYTTAPARHPFWHSVYIGFGFLNNPYGIIYTDTVSINKVKQRSPNAELFSPEYEQTLRQETLLFVTKEPLFVAKTFFAKAGVIFFYLLLAANVGLVAAVRSPKPWKIELAFWLGLLFSSLFGLLVVPNVPYLLGFMAFALLYGLTSLDKAIHTGSIGFLQRAG